MKNKRIIFSLLLLGGATATPSRGVVTLASLQTPTLQTLVNLGSQGVTVGQEQFYNFSFLPGSGSGPTSAAQVQVEPIVNVGLEFVSTWYAEDGGIVNDVIQYDVKSTTAQDPGVIELFSNGTAPVAGTGTFTTSTLTAQTMTGASAAPVLSTYDDGSTYPIDTTKTDSNFASATLSPQPAFQITDSIFATSAAPSSNGSGGFATISIIENGFVTVPEPSMGGFAVAAGTLAAFGFGRRRRAV